MKQKENHDKKKLQQGIIGRCITTQQRKR